MKFHLAVAIAVVFGAASLQAAGRPACTVPLTVGFRVVTFGSIKTGVWYPATTAEASFNYFPATVGSISFNAAPATCGSFPMVVFSHGYTGCGTQAVFLTEELARNGFLVAAPDHSDAGCGVDGTFVAHPNAPGGPQSPYDWTDRTLANRRGDIAAVITAMLSSADFGPSIDPLRIAGMGHSFGGYTIQGMVGGWSSWVDPRIRAALLLSPYSEPFLVQSTLSGLRAPVMYQGGTQDSGITPYISQPGGSFDSTPAPRFFVEFAGASHQLWTNYTCDLSGTVALCLATVPNAKMVVDYATAFLKRYLNEANEPLLWVAASDVPDYRHVSLATTVSAAGVLSNDPPGWDM